MKIELRNVKVSEHLSEETTAFTATIYVDGKKVGVVSNHGHGGPNEYGFMDLGVAERLHEWAKAQPLEFDFDHLDQVIGELLTTHRARQQVQRWCKKQTVFRLKGDNKGEWRTVKSLFKPEVEAFLRKKYGDQVECIANKDIEAALAYC